MERAPLLQVNDLTKSFPGVLALDRVRFTLENGSVHAVCGENGAGKSTLMNILMGLYERDEGEILLNGKPVHFASPRQALKAGISIIEQELNPIPEMTIAENLFLGREDNLFGVWVNYRALRRRTREVLATVGLEKIDPHTKTKQLSLAQLQLVEIAKAVSYDSDIIIMDEPTSAIGERDVETLFGIIRDLKARGKGIVYVSHRMKEIFAISDTITVLRDGLYIDTTPTQQTNLSELVSKMIGRKLEEEFVKSNTVTDEIALRVESLTRVGEFKDVSLDVRHGEILGIFGLMGSGRSEFLHALFGSEPAHSGRIIVGGRPVVHRSARDGIRSGMAFVTEDRKKTGLVLTSSVAHNASLAHLRGLSGAIFVNEQLEQKRVQEMVARFRVKTPSLTQQVRRLSGGNQQKVVLSKWLMTGPRILLLDEPTRGIDVGAKREIYAFMSEFANAGNSVIMISSELPEVLGMSDRIAVFREGSVVEILDRSSANQDALMHLASGDTGVKEALA